MKQLESLGVALIIVATLLGAVLALGLLQWESSSRASVALANPTPVVQSGQEASPPTATVAAQPSPAPTPLPAQPTASPTEVPSTPTAAQATTAPAATPVPTAQPSPPAVASATGAVSTPAAPSPTPAPSLPTATSAPATATSAPATATAAPAVGDITAGAAVFGTTCGVCHPGANAGVGPALHGTAFSAKYPQDSALKAFIRTGRDGMPAFTVAKLGDTDLNNIVAYLRSLK